ncbi:MAG: hypothetical protein HC890_05855 [Chloroflexaceae bacterium]|nr:hypothetical protein [Chloroflexaceae bacterium]
MDDNLSGLSLSEALDAISIPPALYQRLQEIAQRHGESVEVLAQRVIAQYLSAKAAQPLTLPNFSANRLG